MKYDNWQTREIISSMANLGFVKEGSRANGVIYRPAISYQLSEALVLEMVVGKLHDCFCPLHDEPCQAYDVALSLKFPRPYQKRYSSVEQDLYARAALPSDDALQALCGIWGRVWNPLQNAPNYHSEIRWCRTAEVFTWGEAIAAGLACYAFEQAKLVAAIDRIPASLESKASAIMSAGSLHQATMVAMAGEGFSAASEGSYKCMFTGITAVISPVHHSDKGSMHTVSLNSPGINGLGDWLALFRSRAGMEFDAEIDQSDVILTFKKGQPENYPAVAIAQLCRYAAVSAHNLSHARGIIQSHTYTELVK